MRTKLLTLLSTVLFAGNLAAQNATITGIVTGKDTKNYLVGASVLVKGTTKGTVADANGQYKLLVPVGKQTIEFSFIGYQTQTREIEFKANEVQTLNIELVPDAVQLEGLVVSTQAKGQMAAIRRQVNAPGILNVVSEEKLRELPDVNVADAIGRLPGLMIQRDGGEGQKIVIRGLDPKYNAVAINGMSAPATSTTDRSTDLNMISPDMIAGAEVLKANTADKDADGMGGTVNLIMKDAPSGMKLSGMFETGYHSQKNGWGRYKGSLSFSDRFFKDKLGVIMAASADKTDRSNDTFRANYDVSGNEITPGKNYTQPWLTSTILQSNLEDRQRYNVNLNLDWKMRNGSKIKMTNLFSRMNRDRDIREKYYDLSGSRLRFSQDDVESNTSNLTNILQGDFNIGNSTLNVGAGRSQVMNRTPYQHTMEFRVDAPFLVNLSALSYLAPYLIMDERFVDESDIDKFYLYETSMEKESTKETEYTAWLDWKTPFSFGDKVSGYIKLGGKFREKERKLETARSYGRMDLASGFEPVFENMPDLARSSFRDLIGIRSFLDDDFKSREFLNGKYPNLRYDFALSDGAMQNFYNTNKDVLEYTPTSKVRRDYSGREELWAAYLMAELNLGKYITFIPGVRYDYSYLRYKAYSGNNIPDGESKYYDLDIDQTVDSERFGYWLPQIHLRIKPLDGLDIRLAYTKTLSRPDYDLIAPRTIIRPTVNEVSWNRTNLKPVLSTNYDVILSYFSPDYGLFTVSGFYKKIKNFIYTRSAYLLTDTGTDPSNFGLTANEAGFNITYPLNSPYTADLKGLEFDVQLQFRRMNNFLKGLVFSANMTLMDSKMYYFETLKSREKNPNYVTGSTTEKPFVSVNKDVVYVDRLLNQPSLLFNISLGYDYKRFSGRISCNYQDGVLISEQHRQDRADVESTRVFTKWDAQLRYNATKNLSVYFMMSNFTNSSDRKRRDITNFPTRVEYYGSTFYLGLSYDLFK